MLFPLKTCNHNNIFDIPVKELVDYLGIKICKDQKERNNLNFTPTLVYTALALDIKSIIKEVDTMLFNFIWKNRTHYLKKKQFYAIQ